MKRPRLYHEESYPIFPSYDGKTIVLIRDVAPTIHSLLKMNEKAEYDIDMWDEISLAKKYWVKTYTSIVSKVDFTSDDVFLLRYEDLLQNPKGITEKLFKFIGARNVKGTDQYKPPASYRWQWFKDDGGEVIKSLKVQSQRPIQFSDRLRKLIDTDEQIVLLRRQFGYADDSNSSFILPSNNSSF